VQYNKLKNAFHYKFTKYLCDIYVRVTFFTLNLYQKSYDENLKEIITVVYHYMEESIMKELKEKTTPYMTKIKIAINALKSKDYELALISIKQAGLENQNLPEYHNLLGVIAEHNDDLSLACKHYRAAYALDPSYKPAINNLERITNYTSSRTENKPDLGENFELEVVSPSLFLYDLMNSTHKKKYK